MFIYIVRHAWAYHQGDPRWPDDSQRPLEDDGAKRFAQVVKALGARNFAPEVIATSPYVRCRQTADVVARHVDPSPEVVELEALTPGSDFEALVEWSREFGDRDSVCWVGHAPDVSYLAAALVSDATADIRFAKGAVAAIRVDGEIGPNCGELQWLATAKLLGV
jgi:phosphohistidine phosphatase